MSRTLLINKQSKNEIDNIRISDSALVFGKCCLWPRQKKAFQYPNCREVFRGMNDPSKIQASLDLLTDDYVFKNPLVQLKSKVEFIALAGEIGKVVTGVNVKHIASNEKGEVVVFTNSSLPFPAWNPISRQSGSG